MRLNVITSLCAVGLVATAAMSGCASEDPFAGGESSEGSGSGESGTPMTTAMPTTTAATTAMPTTVDSADATGDTSDTADSGSTDDGPVTTGTDACLDTPTRVVVLGDSIFTCVTAGGPEAEGCAPKMVQTHLSERFGPMAYENYAVNGAQTNDIPQNQLGNIPVGNPGHVVVLIYIGGNDLSGFIFSSDEDTIAGYDELRPELDADWAETFAFLQDPANFPDGTTILMNTQYNPFDDCTAPPYNLSETKIEMLRMYNEDLVAKADAQPNAYIADQHAPFLGHGHHYNVDSCPYYQDGAEYWMAAFDLIHPYGQGHVNIGNVINTLADELYAGCE